MSRGDGPRKKTEGYVCNNGKCNGFGTPYYLKYEGEDFSHDCKYCGERMTDLITTEKAKKEIGDVKAIDVMPSISTSGFTHKPRTRFGR